MSRSPYKQGYYSLEHVEKYRGTQPIIYRSGLELSFYRWCDRNSNVIEWGSESVVVPYKSPVDNKIHRYFIDGVLKLKVGDSVIKYIVEVKPSVQTQAPKQSAKKKKSTVLYENVQWVQNQAKWDAARKWGEKNGYSFVILTEKNLR